MGDFCTHHNLVHSTKGSRRANSENETMVKCDHFKIGSTEDLLEWYNDDLSQKKSLQRIFRSLVKFSWNYVMQPKLTLIPKDSRTDSRLFFPISQVILL